jgi:hypothetical protein
MFVPALLAGPPDVEDIDVDGLAGAQIDLAIPVLLERLSIALHRHDTSGTRGPLFRSLATGGSPEQIRRRTATLLAHRDVRAAMTVVLTNAHTLDLAGALEDIAATQYHGPDEEPRELEPGERR